jgi:hypothetical protein
VALLFLAWEAINPVFPAILQELSVSSSLRHLMPVDIGAKGMIALLTIHAEPISRPDRQAEIKLVVTISRP